MNGKGLFQRLILGAVLALGFLATWLLVGTVFRESVVMFALMDRVEDYLSFRADGTVLIGHYENGVVHHQDLHGVSVTLPEDDVVGPLNETMLATLPPWRQEDGDWDSRVRFFTDGRTPHTAWYFVADGRPDGSAYFVGYDSHTKAKIGYLGLAGFRAETPPPSERFPFAGATSGQKRRVFCTDQDGRSGKVSAKHGVYSVESGPATPGIVYVLGLDRKLYEANLRKRTVRVVAHESVLHSLADIIPPSAAAHGDWLMVLRTDKDVLVLDKQGNEQRRYPIPETLHAKPFTFGETTTGEAVMYWNNERDMMATEQDYRLFWVRPDGHSRTAAVTLPFDSGFRWLRVYVTALIPSPLAMDVVGVVRSWELANDGLEPTLSSAFVRTATEFWPSGVLAQLLAAGLAVLCYRRQKRYGLGRGERIAWPLFVLLLGLPGWIGYRFGRKWPVLESCPDCGVIVPRDRENCVRCANEFPSPALKGTEVFA